MVFVASTKYKSKSAPVGTTSSTSTSFPAVVVMLYKSSASVESTQPFTPEGPFVGSVPRLLAVALVFPVSPAEPPSVCTVGQGARPEAPVSTLGPTESMVLAGKSNAVVSLNSFPCSISLS